MFFTSRKYEANNLRLTQPCYNNRKQPKANIPQELWERVLCVPTGSCNKDDVKGSTQKKSSKYLNLGEANKDYLWGTVNKTL